MASSGGPAGSERRVRASILDRLLDDEPDGQPERPPFRVQTRAELARSVVRDLGWLFNARCVARADSVVGVRTVIDYGVDDFTHLVPASEEDRNFLSRAFKDALVAFEPRLKIRQVTVSPIEGNQRAVELFFEARLVVDEISEPVSFRAVLDLSEGGVKVIGR